MSGRRKPPSGCTPTRMRCARWNGCWRCPGTVARPWHGPAPAPAAHRATRPAAVPRGLRVRADDPDARARPAARGAARHRAGAPADVVARDGRARLTSWSPSRSCVSTHEASSDSAWAGSNGSSWRPPSRSRSSMAYCGSRAFCHTGKIAEGWSSGCCTRSWRAPGRWPRSTRCWLPRAPDGAPWRR